MAVNLEALQKKLNQLSGQNSRKNVMWRPPEGEETTIRVIAFPDNDGQPFKERYFYYNIGSNPGLLSPYQFGLLARRCTRICSRLCWTLITGILQT